MSEDPQEYLSDPAELNQVVTKLRLELMTVDAPRAGTDDAVYCNVVFSDGSLLYAPRNFKVDTPDHDDRERGQTDRYALPVPDSLEKKLGEIAELYIRKAGNNGWLLGSALLFANDLQQPVIGNSQINQFLDNDPRVLSIRDWSTRSFCSSYPSAAEQPLLCPSYRILGPVLGQISDTGANVLYRVDREGRYRLRVQNANTGQPVFDEVHTLSPSARFEVRSLDPNTHYLFSFHHVLNGTEIEIVDGNGEFRTFPEDGTGVRFSLAFGSCLRNRDNTGQASWNGIRRLAADPSIDPIANPSGDVRLFLHLGDTFYYHDDVSGKEPKNLRTVLAANVSSRKHPGFLEMARQIPSCAVWDDHDFRLDDGESPNYPALDDSLTGFLSYWGNDPIHPDFGLTTLISYGNVDIYLLDGRIRRHREAGTVFSEGLLNEVVSRIFQRGRGEDRLVILASGSTWNHKTEAGDAYGGDKAYKAEREDLLYSRANELMGRFITGLAFLSGDIHINEIYEVALKRPGGITRVAPEFVSSPLGDNGALRKERVASGERKWSTSSKGSEGRRGFATLEIDTTNAVPENGWTIQVNYYDEQDSSLEPYQSKLYTLSDRQFSF
jgi:alkaline phosphatase D